jgi:predicted deacylase
MRPSHLPLAALLLAASLPAPTGAQKAPLVVGPLRAVAGTRVSGFLEVPAGVDAGTRIPVTLINGRAPGPVLALVAGTHGYEYPPITALQRVRRGLDPATLRGAVILVHVANLPSFLGRTVYYSPVDGKNLNRVYPGKADGTVCDRIADVITREVIAHCDYLVDLHGGDANEALRPYSYWMIGGDDRVDTVSREMTRYFGLDHIVIDRERPQDVNASVYTANTAVLRGKPAITTETGRLGGNDEELVQLAERGVWNLLRYFKMVDGEVSEPGPVVWLEGYEVVRSPVTGIWVPAVQDGWYIVEGGLLGTLYDLFGDPVQEIRAPFEGVVNYVVATPPVSEGEPLGMVSKVVRP